MDPITLANSFPSLLNKIVVGTPLKAKTLDKVIGLSKYILRFSIFKSLKNSLDFFKLSFPMFTGKISMFFNFELTFKKSNDGISSLQGAHHVAQKLSNTNLPL